MSAGAKQSQLWTETLWQQGETPEEAIAASRVVVVPNLIRRVTGAGRRCST
jgi:hypothetical protein